MTCPDIWMRRSEFGCAPPRRAGRFENRADFQASLRLRPSPLACGWRASDVTFCPMAGSPRKDYAAFATVFAKHHAAFAAVFAARCAPVNLNPAVEPWGRTSRGVASAISNCGADHPPGDNHISRNRSRPKAARRASASPTAGFRVKDYATIVPVFAACARALPRRIARRPETLRDRQSAAFRPLARPHHREKIPGTESWMKPQHCARGACASIGDPRLARRYGGKSPRLRLSPAAPPRRSSIGAALRRKVPAVAP